MTDSTERPATNTPPASQFAAHSGMGRRPMIAAAVGGLLTLVAVGLVLKNIDFGPSGDPAQPTLSSVAQSDLGAAAGTLTPSAAGALIADAQSCKVPLVSITLERGSAALSSTIRIRSGNYTSPYFTVTDAMQRIAVPYPAPYGSGGGTFVVEGNATGAILGLTPTKVMIGLPDPQSIPVMWRAVSPC